MPSTSRMLTFINYRMKVALNDKRTLVGTFLAFDRHLNIVLADCEEFRKLKSKGTDGGTEEREERRTLGLVMLRGENIVSLTVESPPPSSNNEQSKTGGPGTSMVYIFHMFLIII